MRSGPAWLALGVIVAAGTVSYAPLPGDAAVAAALAVALAVAAAVAALVCGAAGWSRAGVRLAIAALGASLIAARLAVGLATGPGPVPGAGGTPLPSGGGTWRATVEAAHVKGSIQVATVRLDEPAVRCSALVPAWPRLLAGDVISWSGRIRALGGGDYERWLADQGIAATCDAASMTLESHDESLAGRLEGLRQASGDGLQAVLPEPGGGLAAAILVGLRDRVDRDLAAAFTTAGISHIVAISGWNIAIVAASIGALLRGFVGRRRRAVVTLAAIVAYTVFAGASPSVVRAAFMAAVAMLAQESGRGSRVMVALAWAVAVMLLIEPATAADVGFQLSAAATAGLVAWATPLTDVLDARLPWLPSGMRETLGVSLAAQAATLPIALATFGRLALVAPAANLVAVPLVPPVMAAGAIAFLAGWLALAGAPGPLTGLLALPAHMLLGLLIAVVRVAASVPGASATLPAPANAAAAVAALGFAAWLHRRLGAWKRPAGGPRAATAASRGRRAPPAVGSRRVRVALAGAAFAVVAAGSVVAAAPDGAVHVVVLDVGQGDAILLEGDRGSRILVDGGPDPASLLEELDGLIPAWDRRLDALVLTHPHEDHVAGLAAVVGRYAVGRAFESGRAADSPGYLAWKASLAGHGVALDRLAAGDRIALDGAMLEVLWPDDGRTPRAGLDPAASDNRAVNDSSIVLLGEYEGRRFLLTGDAEDDVDPLLIARRLPRVDLLKVAHHGSATATSGALLDALRPVVAVVSVGSANTYGHPNPGTLARLRSHGALLDRTDENGTIEITLDRAGVTMSTERSGGGAPAGAAPLVPGAGRGEPPIAGAGQGAPLLVGADPGSPLAPGASEGIAPPPRVTAVRPAPAVPSAGRRPRPQIGRSPLLYDSVDVRARPPRQRGSPALARSARVAPAPLARRRRDGSLARAAGNAGGRAPRSPPRGGGGPAP